MVAAAAPQTTLMITMTGVLEFRRQALAVRLEAGVQVLHLTEDPEPGHREARLAAAMEEVVLEDLEGQQMDRLELEEMAGPREEFPLELLEASVAVQEGLVVLVLAEVQDCREAAMPDLMMMNQRESVVPGGRLRDCPEVEGTALDRRVQDLVSD